jgi:hypothetical protein
MDNQTSAALDELEAWADESAHDETQQTPDANPCFSQYQTKSLYSLLASVKGSSLPDQMMPDIPR